MGSLFSYFCAKLWEIGAYSLKRKESNVGTSLTKTQLLTELRNEQAAWEALLAEIGEAHMTQPEVAGGWSIKDIVAHLTGWRRRSVRRFQALLNHAPDFLPPWPPELQEDDEINAWIYESNRNRPLADVLSDSREAFQQLIDTLAAFSEDELQDLRRSLGLEEEQVSGSMFFAHFHQEHEPDMRAWLEKVKKNANSSSSDIL
jgi:uncharacterized damage-inducible protein DinB